MHEITIRTVLNGYVCKVGCQTVVFETIEKLTKELTSYLKDPIGTEKRFRKNSADRQCTIDGPALATRAVEACPPTPPPAGVGTLSGGATGH